MSLSLWATGRDLTEEEGVAVRNALESNLNAYFAQWRRLSDLEKRELEKEEERQRKKELGIDRGTDNEEKETETEAETYRERQEEESRHRLDKAILQEVQLQR